MQAYAAGMTQMQMAYGPYASQTGAAGGGMAMPMPMSPVAGMQVRRPAGQLACTTHAWR